MGILGLVVGCSQRRKMLVGDTGLASVITGAGGTPSETTSHTVSKQVIPLVNKAHC